MTVSSQVNSVSYLGDGVTTLLPVPYYFLEQEHLTVTKVNLDSSTQTLVLGSDYSVSGAGNQAGGSVTMFIAPASGIQIIIDRTVPATQETDYVANDPFPAESHERALDKLTMLVQQNIAGLGRALLRPVGKSYYDAEGRQIKNLADPTQDQDAATVRWATDFIAGILQTGQGPVNNAANVIFVDGDNDVTTVQKGVIKQFRDISKLRLKAGDKDREQATVLGYYSTTPGVGGGRVYWDASSTEADNDVNVFAVVGVATGRWKRPRKGGVWAEHGGVRNDGDTAFRTDNTARLWKVIQTLRKNPLDIVQYVGGATITAYTSGVVNFGGGIFEVDFDQFEITQDLGLTFVGLGGRGTNQAMPGNTTLRFSGTSAGFGLKFYGNGGRMGTIRNMDVCYADSNFTGSLIDNLTSPGMSIRDARIGCFGGTAGTRTQSATALVQSSFDEFMLFDRVVFDGAATGWWSNDVRTLPGSGSTFGGSKTRFRDCLFYDFTQDHMRHAGNRGRQGVVIDNCGFNPINIIPIRGVNLTNVEGLEILGGICTPSSTAIPSEQWLRILNCTGDIKGMMLSTSKAGTLQGMLTVTGVRVACDTGFTLDGGVIVAHGNEFSTGTVGYALQPTIALAVDLGPDLFKSDVTFSYYTPTPSTLLSGRINYNANNDASVSKFVNADGRISVANLDDAFVTQSTLPATGSILQTGRTYNITAAGTFTLPTPIPGTRLRVLKSGATALTIAAAASSNFIVGANGSRTSAVATAADVGAQMEFMALNATTWVARVMAGTWSFT